MSHETVRIRLAPDDEARLDLLSYATRRGISDLVGIALVAIIRELHDPRVAPAVLASAEGGTSSYMSLFLEADLVALLPSTADVVSYATGKRVGTSALIRGSIRLWLDREPLPQLAKTLGAVRPPVRLLTDPAAARQPRSSRRDAAGPDLIPDLVVSGAA